MFLQCKVCGKEFPEYDQRGFRNAGFTAHQNRCVSRTNAAARGDGGGSGGGSGESGTGGLAADSRRGSVPTSRRTSRPRRILPGPPRRSSQPQLSSGSSLGSVPVIRSQPFPHQPPPFIDDQRAHEILQQSPLRIDFFPVQQCDYCTPQQGFHDPSCFFLQCIMDFANNDALSPYDTSSPQR